MNGSRKIVALCGGVGGAKMALGLERRFGSAVTVIVNTGDDFEHLGLRISPDIDTVVYTLAGLSDRERGWGRAGESWKFMDSLRQLGGETWFQLGDLDLAMHVERTRQLRAGVTLTQFTTAMASRLGIAATIVPMSDDRVSTIVETNEGRLPFQRYFVERRCEPVLRGVEFENAPHAKPSAAALAALRDPDLAAILICPSNPYLSIDPILAVPDMREAIRASAAAIVAVSPLVGGHAVKGPTAKIMSELGLKADPLTIARHYDGVLDGLVIDDQDKAAAAALPLPVRVTATLMQSLEDRERLAAECVAFADDLTRLTTKQKVRRA